MEKNMVAGEQMEEERCQQITEEHERESSSVESSDKKQPMTDEERLLLAEKLDRELDEFIENLPKTRYADGWSEDNWEKEMQQHPFFRTKPIEEGEPLPPMLEGLQQIKYDPSINSPEELARTHKDDGNFYFKNKKYVIAVGCYTEGLKQKCYNVELNAQLYTNIAAAHFHIKNYRSSLTSCKSALKIKPDHMKAAVRGAQCCLCLRLYDECLQWCDRGLQIDSKEKTLLEVRKKAQKEKKAEERDQRKNALREKKSKEEEEKVISAIRDRGIRLGGSGKDCILDMSSVEACHPAALQNKVHLDDNGELVWPVMFLYPECGETDFIMEFHENSRFISHLEAMFGPNVDRPPWDLEDKYHPSKLRLYFEDKSKSSLCEVSKDSTLLETLSNPRYTVMGGTPGFIVLVDGSTAHMDFLEKYKH